MLTTMMLTGRLVLARMPATIPEKIILAQPVKRQYAPYRLPAIKPVPNSIKVFFSNSLSATIVQKTVNSAGMNVPRKIVPTAMNDVVASPNYNYG